MKQFIFICMLSTVVVMACQPALAQFPSSLEEQLKYAKEKKEQAKKKQEELRKKQQQQQQETKSKKPKVKDPRKTKDPRVTKPKQDPSPSSAYPTLKKKEKPKATPSTTSKRKKLAVCDIAIPKFCSELLAEANRSCSNKATRCRKKPSSTEDQSCAVMRCDIDKAGCMKGALDDYVDCMEDGMIKAGARF